MLVKIRFISVRTQRIMQVLCLPIMQVLSGSLILLYLAMEKTGAKNILAIKILIAVFCGPMGVLLVKLFGESLISEYFCKRLFDRKDQPILWLSFCLGLLLLFLAASTLTNRFIWPS